MEIKHITISELDDRIKRNDGNIKEGLKDLRFRLWSHSCKANADNHAASYYATNHAAYCSHCNKPI